MENMRAVGEGGGFLRSRVSRTNLMTRRSVATRDKEENFTSSPAGDV